MKRTSAPLLAVTAFVGWLSLIPAHAAPPTVSPSPGYDARLQEQRTTTTTVQQPVMPVLPPVQPRRSKKPPAH